VSFPVGIGIVPYNRRATLSHTLDRIVGAYPSGTALVRVQQRRARNACTRALCLLSHLLGSEITMPLDYDTQPNRAGTGMHSGRGRRAGSTFPLTSAARQFNWG
jgi:hypothetical protein